MSRIVICFDSFKGSISSIEAAEAFASGWSGVHPEDEIDIVAFADGGEGTADAILANSPSAERIRLEDGASWIKLTTETALVELAENCGLTIQGTSDPLGATTLPLGRALRAAIESGAKEILVAVGGSASTDGGSGVMVALGVKLLDEAGNPVASGNRGLQKLSRVDFSQCLDLSGVDIRVLTDVENPLLGENGAAKIFGPQKGASPTEVEILEQNLKHFAQLFDHPDPNMPGTGAAGGTAFGLVALGAKIESGASYLANLVGLPERIAKADLVITGEGSFDSQTEAGKAVSIVLACSKQSGTKLHLVAGVIAGEANGFASQTQLVDIAPSRDAAIEDAAKYLFIAATKLAKSS